MNCRVLLYVTMTLVTFTSLAGAQSSDRIVIIQPVGHATSPRLSEMLPGPRSPERQVVPVYKPNKPGRGGSGGGSFTDQLWQKAATTSSAVLGLSFEGIGAGLPNYDVNYIPPDTNGAVGTKQYVQAVNVDLAAFGKDGHTVLGPMPLNTFWSAVGGACAQQNGGDPIVQFDKLNNRWVIMQIQYSGFGGGGGNYLCIAVSDRDDWGDPNLRFNAYAYKFNTLTDYPKMGIWNDGYYVTFNAFKGFGTFAGPVVCAFDGASMLSGANAAAQCATLSTGYSSLLPADIDSSIPPVKDEPEYLVSMGNNSLNVWRFHVDWTDSAKTVLLGPATAATASFAAACGGGACIPQSDTTQQLDSLGDRLMYRLAYRHFDGWESLVVNHSVKTDSQSGVSGIRWYELRNTPSNSLSPTAPIIYQAGTYAPVQDGTYPHRWMGSIAMDDAGNLAVGYSESSSSMSPTIRLAGRCSADSLGRLRSEVDVLPGIKPASQSGYDRWGDYAAMSVDPVDGSLWFTTEYLATPGSNWHTRIARFNLTCP